MVSNKKRRRNSEPVNVILIIFVESLNIPRADEYRSVTSAFGVKGAFSNCSNPNAARCFLDLLPKLLFSKHKEKVKDLITDINKDLKENDIWRKKSTYKCYLNSFIEFIQNKNNITKITQGLKKYKSQLIITPADEALLEGVDGEMYTYSVLKTKFKSRLRSQDRVSGDKIWLPLRFIAKIYSTYVKKQKQKGITMPNAYLDWLNSLVDDIYILYNKIEDGEEKIMNVKFCDIVSLRLEKKITIVNIVCL